MTSEEPGRMAILTARLQVVSRQFDNWESDSRAGWRRDETRLLTVEAI